MSRRSALVALLLGFLTSLAGCTAAAGPKEVSPPPRGFYTFSASFDKHDFYRDRVMTSSVVVSGTLEVAPDFVRVDSSHGFCSLSPGQFRQRGDGALLVSCGPVAYVFFGAGGLATMVVSEEEEVRGECMEFEFDPVTRIRGPCLEYRWPVRRRSVRKTASLAVTASG